MRAGFVKAPRRRWGQLGSGKPSLKPSRLRVFVLVKSTGGHNPALKKVDATDLDNRGESCGSLVAKANGAGLAGIERSSLDKPERHAIAIKQTSQ